jgi:hypothetical protein
LNYCWRPVQGDEGVGAAVVIVYSASFVVEKRVLPGRCRVWVARSPGRTALLRLAVKTVGLWPLKLR